MKFLLISPKNRTVYNFRGELIKLIVSKGYEVIVTGPDMTDVDLIEALGARFVELPIDKNGTNVSEDLRYYRALKALMRSEKPDATLSYTVKPVVYGCTAAKKAGVKNVNCLITGAGYTFASRSDKAKLLGALVRRLYRHGLRKADCVIFQNPDDRDEFCARGLIERQKTRLVNGSGVDLMRFSPAPMPGNVTFFMLSRILKSKGVSEYLEAARKVKRIHPKARFMLLGKYETSMQDALESNYVEGFIQDGVVERFDETNDVRPYYAMCSVFVLPSYREGTPRTVLEAMAMGRPVITTDAPGCRETVIDGKNGFLVPVGDVDALADRMTRFIEDPGLIESMGSLSRSYAEEKYDSKLVNAEMLRHMRI